MTCSRHRAMRVVALAVVGAAALSAAEPLSIPTDRFGGRSAVTSTSTGHFAVEKVRGRWWLVTPEGHGMFALGVNHLNEVKNSAEYPHTVLAQRFGTDWPRVFGEIERQCREWGFNCAGFHTPEEMRRTMPYVVNTPFASASFFHDPLTYIDVFAPAFAAAAEAKAKAAAAEMKANPMAIAWTWNDSLSWDLRGTRQSRGTDFVSFMRGLPRGAPGRERYTAFLRTRHDGDVAKLNAAYGTNFSSFESVGGVTLDLERPAVFADDREFLRLIARHYYQTVSAGFRREHPRGLLMGDRFHLRDHPDEVLEEAAKFIDVLGIQPGDHHYPSPIKLTRPDETQFDAAEFDRLHRLTGKPIVIADHQCGFFDAQTPKTGGWHQYPTAEEAADSYDRFLHDACARPYIIGYFRCQYLTTYKDRLKRFKQGLLRPDGTPFEDYVTRLQETNRRIIDASR